MRNCCESSVYPGIFPGSTLAIVNLANGSSLEKLEWPPCCRRQCGIHGPPTREQLGSATEDPSEERPPTSLRTVAARRSRGLFSEVLVLGCLEGLARTFRHIVVAQRRRGRADRTTSRKFEDEGRNQNGNDHSAEDSRMRTGEQCGRVNRQRDHLSLGGALQCKRSRISGARGLRFLTRAHLRTLGTARRRLRSCG